MRVDLLRWRVECERVVVAAFMFEWQAREYVELRHFQKPTNIYNQNLFVVDRFKDR